MTTAAPGDSCHHVQVEGLPQGYAPRCCCGWSGVTATMRYRAVREVEAHLRLEGADCKRATSSGQSGG